MDQELINKNKYSGGRPRVYPHLVNPELSEILKKFEKAELENNWFRLTQWRRLWPEFEESLGDLGSKISSEADFNAATFHRQAEYIRLWAASCEEKRQQDFFVFTSVLPLFYRYLEKVLDRLVFAEGASVTSFLLSTPSLSRFLRIGAVFAIWDYSMEYIPGRDFYVVTVHGLDQMSTQMGPVDFVTLDLSPLEPQYKKMFFRYFLSSPNRIVRLHNQPLVHTYKRMLDEYLRLKAEPGYSTPDVHVMTNLEMEYMRDRISDLYKAKSSANTVFRYFIDFARWAEATGYLKCDIMHLNSLRHFRMNKEGRKKGIPQKHLEMIIARAKDLSSSSIMYACCYVVLRLLITTKMRISGLTALSWDCFHQSPDRGVWQVVAPSKTSRQGKEVFTVTDSDCRALEAVRAVTEPLRAIAERKGFGERLFIYDGRSGVRMMDRGTFSRYLITLCNNLDIPVYTPNNLRSSRMTRASKYAEEHGLDKYDTVLLTGHSKKETTMNNYITVPAKDFYGALYHVMLEDVQSGVQGRVVERIQQGAEPAAGEGARLGACVKEDLCTARTLLPCLTCPSFITDVSHLPLFEEAIEDIDRRIETATVPHDREDLVTIKEIYVLYITKIKEVLCGSKAK